MRLRSKLPLYLGTIFAFVLGAGIAFGRQVGGIMPDAKQMLERVEAGTPASSNVEGSNYVSYYGVKACGKIKVEVTFKYDPAKRQIKNFESLNRCVDGGTNSLWDPAAVIDVKDDSSFYYETPSGTWVRGKLDKDGATGTFNESGINLSCNDGKSYPECTEWVASPKQ